MTARASWGIALIWLCLMLSACATAQLETVMVGDRLAYPQEVQKVEVIREGEELEVRLRLPLKPGDEIRTDASSIALLKFTNGTEIFVLPNSHVIYQNPSILVVLGEILAKIKGTFRVETEGVSVLPEGTVFLVRVKSNNEACVLVVEGKVRLASKTQRWSPIILAQFEKGIIRHKMQPPGKSKMHIDEYNDIVTTSNQVEHLLKKTKPRLLLNDLVGLQLEKAKKILTHEGFVIGRIVQRVTGKFPVGTISEQRPQPGLWVKQGLRVDLVVEAKPAKVPSLINRPYNTAAQVLQKSHLRIGQTHWNITGKYPANTIINQNPKGTTLVPEETAVDLWVEEVSVVVPDVVGLPLERAKMKLQSADCDFGSVRDQVTGSRAPGIVLSHTPAKGTRIRPHSHVQLVVEAESVIVPSLVGQHVNQASAMLQERRLLMGPVRKEITGGRPTGTVLSQSPTGGTRVRLNSEVQLVVEAESMLVPAVVGLPLNQARAILNERRLNLSSVREEITGRYPVGTVLRQSPTGGVHVSPQSRLQLVVEADSVVVPNLHHLNSNQARQILQQGRLTLGHAGEVVTGQAVPGAIVSQTPNPGMRVKPSTMVRVTFEAQKIVVPNVSGWPQAKAQAHLQNYGFQIGSVTTQATNRFPRGSVIRQSPTPGSHVVRGTRVNLVISVPSVIPVQPLSLCSVPDVRYKTFGEAVNILTMSGFKYNVKMKLGSDQNRVYGQSPAPGQRVSCGQSIDLTLGQLR